MVITETTETFYNIKFSLEEIEELIILLNTLKIRMIPNEARSNRAAEMSNHMYNAVHKGEAE